MREITHKLWWWLSVLVFSFYFVLLFVYFFGFLPANPCAYGNMWENDRGLIYSKTIPEFVADLNFLCRPPLCCSTRTRPVGDNEPSVHIQYVWITTWLQQWTFSKQLQQHYNGEHQCLPVDRWWGGVLLTCKFRCLKLLKTSHLVFSKHQRQWRFWNAPLWSPCLYLFHIACVILYDISCYGEVPRGLTLWSLCPWCE